MSTAWLRRLAAVSALSICASMAAGCASADVTDSIELPPQNQDAWAMPLDEFSSTSDGLRDYAEALLERPCYAEYGMELNVPWQSLDRGGLGPGYSPTGRAIFTVEVAETWGYHRIPHEWDGKDEWLTYIEDLEVMAQQNPRSGEAHVECLSRSRGQLPLANEDELFYVSGANYQLYEEAMLDPGVTSLVDDWADCMEKAGYHELTDNPDLMPAATFATEWEIGIPFSAPKPQEIEMATADANCQEESGWVTALYQAEWERQATFVQSNADRLIRIRDAHASERQMLEKVISDNAPKR